MANQIILLCTKSWGKKSLLCHNCIEGYENWIFILRFGKYFLYLHSWFCSGFVEHGLLDVAERQDFADLSLLQSNESATDGSLDELVGNSDLLDTSQDSLEFDDDNASTISHLSGLSDLSGQDWKPRAGSMIWVSSCSCSHISYLSLFHILKRTYNILLNSFRTFTK